MIQANEAVVGRWFNRKHGKGHTWTQLDEGIIGSIFSESLEYALDDFEPIPLTPEILIKSGGTNMGGWAGYFVDLHLCGDDQTIVFQLMDGALTIVANDVIFFYSEKPFVHQLQNLYFALTNTELEIKL